MRVCRVEGLVAGVLWEWEVCCLLFWLWDGSVEAAGGPVVVSMGLVAIFSSVGLSMVA